MFDYQRVVVNGGSEERSGAFRVSIFSINSPYEIGSCSELRTEFHNRLIDYPNYHVIIIQVLFIGDFLSIAM